MDCIYILLSAHNKRWVGMFHEKASNAQPNVRMNPKTAKAEHFPGADPTNPFRLDGATRGNRSLGRTADPAPPSPSSTRPAMVRDPVCGRQVEPTNAPGAVFKDKRYFFCTANCQNQFDQDPQRYIRTGLDIPRPSTGSDKSDGPVPPA
jgi:YHS domain-containing protein